MHIRNILFGLALATAGLAFQQGEIPSNIAVRTNAQGEIEYFHERDRIQHEAMKRQSEPESDTYPVTNDGSGVKPFTGAAISRRRDISHSGVRRQAKEPESDTYPVVNDGSGVKPFQGAGVA